MHFKRNVLTIIIIIFISSFFSFFVLTMGYFILGDTHRYIEAEHTTATTRKTKWTQILVTIAVAFCAFLLGFTTTWSGPSLPLIKEELGITGFQGSMVVSSMPLAALIGSIISGTFMINVFGRKSTLLIAALPFSIGYLLVGFSYNLPMLLLGRSLNGLSVGICSLALPVFMVEMIEPENRGMLGVVPAISGNTGILLCFVMGGFHSGWRLITFSGLILTVPYVILTFIIPESPYWYASKGNHERGEKAILWLYGPGTSEMYKKIQRIADLEKLKSEESTSMKKYFYPIFILMGLMFCQQLSGVNVFFFYAVQFFEEAGTDGHLGSILLATMNIIASIVAAVLIDILGRKLLLRLSSSIMAIMLTGFAFYLYYKDSMNNNFTWVPVVLILVYIAAFSIGYGPIPWLMIGEILPAKIRGTGASVAAAVNYISVFITTLAFSPMINQIGLSGCCWFYSLMCILAFIITIFVPETKGLSLEDIQDNFTEREPGSNKNIRRINRITPKAFVKPLPLYM